MAVGEALYSDWSSGSVGKLEQHQGLARPCRFLLHRRRFGVGCARPGRGRPMTEYEPVPDGWSAERSQVMRAIRAPRPSQTPEAKRAYQRSRVRLGKKAATRLRQRIALLEAQLADRPTQSVEIEPGGSLKLEIEKSRAPGLSEPRPKTGEPPIVDSRRPDPAEVEARAQAAEARHRALAEAYRAHAFALNLLASRGLTLSRWTSPYWRSSPY